MKITDVETCTACGHPHYPHILGCCPKCEIQALRARIEVLERQRGELTGAINDEWRLQDEAQRWLAGRTLSSDAKAEFVEGLALLAERRKRPHAILQEIASEKRDEE